MGCVGRGDRFVSGVRAGCVSREQRRWPNPPTTDRKKTAAAISAKCFDIIHMHFPGGPVGPRCVTSWKSAAPWGGARIGRRRTDGRMGFYKMVERDCLGHSAGRCSYVFSNQDQSPEAAKSKASNESNDKGPQLASCRSTHFPLLCSSQLFPRLLPILYLRFHHFPLPLPLVSNDPPAPVPMAASPTAPPTPPSAPSRSSSGGCVGKGAHTSAPCVEKHCTT